jgi:hypothetical protein
MFKIITDFNFLQNYSKTICFFELFDAKILLNYKQTLYVKSAVNFMVDINLFY